MTERMAKAWSAGEKLTRWILVASYYPGKGTVKATQLGTSARDYKTSVSSDAYVVTSKTRKCMK